MSDINIEEDTNFLNEDEIDALMNQTQDFFEEQIIPTLKKYESDSKDTIDMTRYIMFVNAVYALLENGWDSDELQELVMELSQQGSDGTDYLQCSEHE